MALPVTIPNTFANATASIPLSQLDTNFTTLANAVNGISDGSETLANASVTVLTAGTVDINGGAIDGTTVGTSNAAAGSFTTLNTSGAVVFNDAGADVDFRVEGDTDANLLFVDASAEGVGIGTNTPSQKLQVNGNIRLGSTSTTDENVEFQITSGGQVVIHANNAATQDNTFVGCTMQSGVSPNVSSVTVLGSASASFNDIRFNTTNTERMRIDSSGNLLVGTTSAIDTMPFQVVGATAGQVLLRHSGSAHWRVGPDSVANDLIIYSSSTGGVYISNTGTSWNARSDERCKTDLIPIEDGLNKVSSLRAVTGRYIEDEEGVSRSFLIAQDVQAVLPEAVDSHREYLGLSYTDTIPLLVAAIKELKTELDTVKAELATLKG